MSNYDVHVYPVIRITVRVSAASPEEAAKLAEEKAGNYADWLQNGAEPAEELTGFLVDLMDDEGEVAASMWMGADGKVDASMTMTNES
jgi:hypothetical protein